MERFSECPLAVVGMGACLPGAFDLAELWTLLLERRCALGPLPPSRLDRELYYDPARGVAGKTYAAIGGVVAEGSLDVGTLGLAAGEAAQADIAHLWLLKVALDAVGHAGIVPAALEGSRTGVFVGHARGSSLLSDLAWAAGIEALAARVGDAAAVRALPPAQREALLRDLVAGTRARYPGVEAAATPMMQANAAARLVAQRLRTTGPAMVIDAACASSFAALDLAARALHAGEVELAIVGGCSFSQWSSLVMFSQAQALSATGSFPFDARGDGFVSSDGYVAVVVEPLAAAIRAGHRVLAVIRGIGASCDGRGKALWAPQRRGQVEAMRRAYGASTDPASVQVVEAHATGTQVGDDTEVQALAEVFGPGRAGGARLPIGSVKGNVGHTREAAGLTSLVKMVLALERGVVPPTAGFDPATPTRRVAWDTAPLRVVAAPEPWPDAPGRARRCAVDCFGIGGLNFHVVLEGAPPPVARQSAARTAPAAQRATVVERAPVAIVGAGVLLPGAHSLAAFERGLDDPPAFAPPPRERWDASLFLDPAGGPYRLRSVVGAFLDSWRFDCVRHRIPPRQAERTDPLQLMLLEAATQALAGPRRDPLPNEVRARTGVFVGSVFGSDHMADLNIALRLPELERDLARRAAALGLGAKAARALAEEAAATLRRRFPVHDEAGSFSSSTLASRIARHFDLHGVCMAIDAEEASALAALAAAMRALAAGDCDLALCCAGARTMHFGRFMYYDRLGWLAGGARPGVVPGEGAAALLLRRAADAEAAGERVLAVIDTVRGASAYGAPWEALARAARDAAGDLGGAALPALIECFSGDGSTVAAGERRALGELAQGAVLRSPTPRVGMTQGASGLVAVVEALARAGRGEAGGAPSHLAVNAVGLQGLAYHARLHAPTAAPSAAVSATPVAAGARIARFEAATGEELLARIGAALSDGATAWDRAAATGSFRGPGSWRLAVVADSPAALAAGLAAARAAIPAPETWGALAERGVFLHAGGEQRQRVAFVFGGQGSQYAGMLRDLVGWNAAARDAAAEWDELLAAAGERSVAELCWEEGAGERLGRDTRATQIAVLVADLVVHRALAAAGLVADVVLGHSFGEYPALVAAGSWTGAEALAAVRERCRVLEALGPAAGRLIATTAVGDRLAAVLAALGGRGVSVASANSPEQTVVAAANQRVDEVIAALTAAGETAREIPAPQPFHSPLLAPAQPELRRALGASPLSPPRTPFLSSVDARYAADPDDLRERLVRQLAEPFSFVDVIRRAFADGVGVFVEVGPRSVATRLVRAILKGEPAVAIASDHPKVDSRHQLLRVRAALEAAGAWPAAAAERAPDGVAAATYASTRRPPAPAAGSVPHVDATAARRARAGATTPSVPAPAAAAPAPPVTEAERLVVAFVSEHTGYPPETISLDLDLEADLGIDSIRKAQLLGELADRFALAMPAAADGALDLASLVTLRDVARAVGEPHPLAGRGDAGSVDRAAGAEPPASRPAVSGDRPAAKPAPERAAVRWVLRVEEIGPAREGAPRPLPTVLLGGGAAAEALAAELRRTGSEAAIVAPGAAAASPCLAAARRLVLLDDPAGAGRPATAGARSGATAGRAVATVLAVRRWVAGIEATGGAAAAELVAVTRLGGDLAFSPAREIDPAGGAAAGLVKALARELAGLRGRVIDLPLAESPAALARDVVRELAEGAGAIEIGLARGRRFVVAMHERPLAAARSRRWDALAPDGAWIVTGGASGITARCALALGSRLGVRVHLIGSTTLEPVPAAWLEDGREAREAARGVVVAHARERGELPAAAWARAERQIERQCALAALARAGVRHTYHCADAGDRRSLAAALRAIRAEGEPIRGIVHGAGFEAACAITAKRPAAVRATLRAKVAGIEHLLALTASDPIAAVIGFGSVSGRWGGRGQADYAAANELLAKLLSAHRRRTGVRCTTIHWPPWDETGMATRPETRLALEQAGWRLMPAAEGVAHFLRELESGLPESEVVIADRAVVAARQTELGCHVEVRSDRRRHAAAARGPLVEATWSPNGNGHRRVEVLLDPVGDAFLVDHRLDGVPLLPAMVSLEALAEAALATVPEAFAFRDAGFHAALRFFESRPLRVEVDAHAGDDGVRAELRAEQALRNGRLGDTALLYASATVQAVAADAAPALRPPPPGLSWREVEYGAANGRRALRIEHGPSLRALRRLGGKGDGGWGELVAPAAAALRARAGNGWLLPVALLDGCLVACGLYARERFGVLALPASFAELRVFAVPRAGTRCTVALVVRERGERHLRFDFTLATDDGRAVAAARGYRAAALAERPVAR